MSENGQVIGKIVEAPSQIQYTVYVYQRGDVRKPPAPDDFAFGRFVRVDIDDRRALVGVIYNTILHNPEFGRLRLGPRLATDDRLSLFTPDFTSEKATLVEVVAVGMLDADRVMQGVPAIAAQTDVPVRLMDAEEIRQFHQEGERCVMRYQPLLASLEPFGRELLIAIARQLRRTFPAEKPAFDRLIVEITQSGTVFGDGSLVY